MRPKRDRSERIVIRAEPYRCPYEPKYYSAKPVTWTLSLVTKRTRYYATNPSVGILTQSVARMPYTWNDKRLGTSVKGWREKISEHQSATSAFTGEKYLLMAEPGSMQVQILYANGDVIKGSLRGLIGYNYATTPSFTWASVSAADNVARMCFYKNLRKAQSSLAAGVFTGELRETYRMFRTLGRGIRGGLSQYLTLFTRNKRHLDRMRPERLQEFVADAHLTLAFGINPLMNDLQSIAGLMESLLGREGFKVVKGVGITEASPASDVYRNEPIFDGYLRGQIEVRRYGQAKVRYLAGVVREVDGPMSMLQSLAMEAGLSSWLEFVPTIWELLPWSFFIDYFSNIGGVIEATVLSTAGVKWTNRTERSKGVVTTLGSVDKANTDRLGYKMWSCDGFGGKYQVDATRVIRSGQPAAYPDLTIRLPGRKEQWYNIAALFQKFIPILPRPFRK